jgi:hypothetical protein
VTIEYMEPVMGEVTLWADSPEEAVNTIRANLSHYTVDIKEVTELDSLPDDLVDLAIEQSTSTIN